jgi:hypothetical protein
MLQLLVFLTNCLPTIENGCQNGIHYQQRAPVTYEYANDIIISNNVTQFYIIWTITWYFSFCYGRQ